MRLVILLVVGIISISPGMVGATLSNNVTDSSAAPMPSEAPDSAPSFHRVDPSQPLNARRDYAIEAFFELEEEENQGFSESLFSRANSDSPGTCFVAVPILTTRSIASGWPIPSGRSSLLRC